MSFSFTPSQKRGLLVLVVLIILVQLGFYLWSLHNQETLIDERNDFYESQLDSLRQLKKKTFDLKPFNPNFLTDYRAYFLAISPDVVDKVNAWRKKDIFVNSIQEFQQRTQLPDSIIQRIQPYFKFPSWTQAPQKRKVHNRKIFEKKDLNTASLEALKTVHGIGPILASRIVNYRTVLGGFLHVTQLNEVYGLEEEVVVRLLDKFEIQSTPTIQKIDVNSATITQLTALPYITPSMARALVVFRTSSGMINSLDSLEKVNGFTSEKIKRIKLYLFCEKEK